MDSANKADVLALALSKYIDRHGSNELDALIEGLSDDEKAWVIVKSKSMRSTPESIA